jgi:23S rRNA (cytosine1962-C5)-methyltransferase
VLALEDGEGDVVRVADDRGRTIGRAWLSAASAIRARIFDRGDGTAPEDEIVSARVAAAVALRARLFPDPARTDAYRLLHGEADGVPGLVADRFGSVLVAQFSTRPLVARRERLAALLLATSGAASLVARPGGKEAVEGIAPDEVAFAAGAPAPQSVLVREEGLVLEVDLRRGQKTGHYADQRENRRFVAEVARGATVLDLHAGTGGFSVRALAAGAVSALAVDSSGPALDAARRNAAHNGVVDRFTAAPGDVGERLEACARAGERFGVVVADPPRFAATRQGLAKAIPAYRRLNARALGRVDAGGFLATFSCSGAVDPATFQETVRAAARESGRTASVLRVLAAGPDHPVALAAPEGRYLTGLLLRVDA